MPAVVNVFVELTVTYIHYVVWLCLHKYRALCLRCSFLVVVYLHYRCFSYYYNHNHNIIVPIQLHVSCYSNIQMYSTSVLYSRCYYAD